MMRDHPLSRFGATLAVNGISFENSAKAIHSLSLDADGRLSASRNANGERPVHLRKLLEKLLASR